MCYSAQIEADYRRYVREFGASLSVRDFTDIFWLRKSNPRITIPKAMEAAFAQPSGEAEREIKSAIDAYHAEEQTRLQQELFKQRTRLADAERALQNKPTKAASESRRIAASKVERALGKLADLQRVELQEEDSRIFPGNYAPVLVMEHGQRVVKPMRYQCRPAGKPASHDTRYPGTYNARRDNLEGFWQDVFGYAHGLVIVNAFYENVSRHRVEGRELAPGEVEQNMVLEFRPRPRQDMLIACLWSRWSGRDQPDLLSFAAITDEPPSEVAAAGHDRCIVPIRPEHVDAWLNPDPAHLAAQYAILDDRAPLVLEHRKAA